VNIIQATFIKRLADAIIWGRDNGIDMNLMESGFGHAWMHVYLLNMKDTPPIPEVLSKEELDAAVDLLFDPPNAKISGPLGSAASPC
jgi:hypothetical protein